MNTVYELNNEINIFCDKWLQIEAFRENSEEEWKPITSDMNSIRVTMVSELRDLINKFFEIIT